MKEPPTTEKIMTSETKRVFSDIGMLALITLIIVTFCFVVFSNQKTEENNFKDLCRSKGGIPIVDYTRGGNYVNCFRKDAVIILEGSQ